MLCTRKGDGKIDLQMIPLTFYEEGDANEKAGKKTHYVLAKKK
jgi:hypothetical protein